MGDLSQTSLESPSKIPIKSYLDLVNDCDNFPYITDVEKYGNVQTEAIWLRCSGHIIGIIHKPILQEILLSQGQSPDCQPGWNFDSEAGELSLLGSTVEERSEILARTINRCCELKQYKVLDGWRDELYAIYAPRGNSNEGQRELLFNVERSAASLLGVVTYGAHMNAYVWDAGRMKIWVPRRATSKQTYGGYLDNSVAGGITSDDGAWETIIREAAEEASIPRQMMTQSARPCGAVTYFHITNGRSGEDIGLYQPECQYVYDIELPLDFKPRPGDNEVESFTLMTVEEVQDQLRKGNFGPSCTLVMLDFFIRKGIMTAENEPSYVTICSRLHRKFEYGA
ncbi:MAG: hypothetical protein M1829_004883 [Trizodia sp. TS-e1964]|nr:MAG: hypothetical protein M1829_004883 [Trizodia sp. TS-e1964]